ncbi:alanine dehydrogenase [Bacteroidota bacterium]|nr:alanine dehydrogenase [Bacteroidota bacterium]
MEVGVPREIKNNECRVGLTPDSVKALTKQSETVFVEKDAGKEIGFTNEMYEESGATILHDPKSVYAKSELIIKVKEPLPEEYAFLDNTKTLFTYLHLAGNKQNSKQFIKTGVTGIAYETVTSEDGSLPLLSPMSQIAGKISIVVGSYFLLKPYKGIGTLLGKVGEIDPRIVTIIGAGVAGKEAAKKALSVGSHVKVLDLSVEKLNLLKDEIGNDRIEYLISSEESIKEAISDSDLVIGSVYIVGREAPTVITKEMITLMKPGSVLVDISIDQGGCIETSRPTTHDNPTFVYKDVVHYCVTNMPGAVPLTATLALNEATLPYIKDLCKKGVKSALEDDRHLQNGLNVKDGKIMHPSLIGVL